MHGAAFAAMMNRLRGSQAPGTLLRLTNPAALSSTLPRLAPVHVEISSASQSSRFLSTDGLGSGIRRPEGENATSSLSRGAEHHSIARGAWSLAGMPPVSAAVAGLSTQAEAEAAAAVAAAEETGAAEEAPPREEAVPDSIVCSSSKELLEALGEAKAASEVAALWRGNDFEAAHVVAALERLSGLSRHPGSRSEEAGEVIEALARRLESDGAQGFTPGQQAESVFWLSSMSYVADEALTNLRGMLRGDCSELSVPHAAMVMWSLARIGNRVPYKLQRSVDRRVQSHVRSGGSVDPKSTARLLWAHAVLGHWQSTSFEALEPSVVLGASEGAFSLGDLINIAHSYSLARKHRAKGVLDAAAAHLAPRVPEMRWSGTSKALHAFAKARHPAPELFSAAAAHATDNLATIPYQDLSVIAWASARLHPGSSGNSGNPGTSSREAAERVRALLEATRGIVQANPERFAPHELSKLLWSFACAGLADASLVRRVSPLLRGSRRLPRDDLIRLLQIELLLEPRLHHSSSSSNGSTEEGTVPKILLGTDEAPVTDCKGTGQQQQQPVEEEGDHHPPLLPPEISNAAHAAWRAVVHERSGEGRSSAAPGAKEEHVERLTMLCAALDRMQVPYKTRVPLGKGLIELDLVTELPGGQKTLLEVNGPYYFASSPGPLGEAHQQLGRLALRSRIIEACAPELTVVRVPFFEWDALESGLGGDAGGVLAAQLFYLRSKLSEAASASRK